MNYEDVQKLANAAKAKIGLLNGNFLKYFLRAVMAGFFIDMAMIYSNVVGNVFSANAPEWGKFLGALVFSIAVLLICLVGGELFTGNNMVMAFGAYDKSVSWKDAGKVWLVSYIGNFVGCADPGSDLCMGRGIRYSRLFRRIYQQQADNACRPDVLQGSAL